MSGKSRMVMQIFLETNLVDDFVIEVEIYDAQGNVYATYQYDYSYSHNWTTHSGQELFTDPFLPPSYFDRVEITAQGSDSANWQGWYETSSSTYKILPFQ